MQDLWKVQELCWKSCLSPNTKFYLWECLAFLDQTRHECKCYGQSWNMNVWIARYYLTCTNLTYQCHKCPVLKIIPRCYFDHQWSSKVYLQTMIDADNVMRAAYCFVMGLSSSPNDRLCAFLIPMCHLMEFGLILDLRKWPSYLMLYLFCKYWRCDKLLEVERFKMWRWLFPRYKFQKYQFSRCLQQLKSQCCRHELWDMV